VLSKPDEMAKTIFITGASRGLGKIWAEAFLDRGDHVVVTSRNMGSLNELVAKYGSAVLPLELDISSKAACAGTTVTKFNSILSAYFESGLLEKKGLPTVAMFAAELHLSPRYLSDLLKQETGKTAMDLIQLRLISEAKNLLHKGEHTVAEIAYILGFENPPYFSRLFRKETGMSPKEYKRSFLN
jgi:AraC-like DNA-binding protein